MLIKQHTKLLWFVGMIMFFLFGLSVAQVVLLANLHASGTLMARTTESTVGMRQDMNELRTRTEAWMHSLSGDLPEDQLKKSTRKLLNIVENVQELTARFAQVTPARVEGIIQNTHDITIKLSEVASQVDLQQSRALVSRIGELIGGITPELMTRWFTSLAELADHASQLGEEATQRNLTARVSETLETLQEIGKRVSKLHELTLKI